MKKTVTILVVIAVLVILFFILGPFYIISEGEQAVVTRFGEIVNTIREAGLKFKMPLVDSVTKYPKKILSWDGDARRIPTAENQFIWVDTTARWRIEDPKLFYESVTSLDQAFSRLDDVIESAVRTTISQNSLQEAVRNSNIINEIERELPVEPGDVIQETGEDGEVGGIEEIQNLLITDVTQEPIGKGRRQLMEEMLASASQVAPDYGIELIDIIIRQIRYSDDLTNSVYDRMISERTRIAQAYRSYGEGRKQDLLGQLENEKRTILSEAYETSETIKGNADAEAASIYSAAYEQDPNFFEFWRAVESYRKILPRFKKTLTTDMEYFKFLYDMQGQ
jgi:membrane protease subunit HflC